MTEKKTRNTADVKHTRALTYLVNANRGTSDVSVYPLNNNGAMLRIIATCNAILNDDSTWVASDIDTPDLVDVYNPQVLCFQVDHARSLIVNGAIFYPRDYSVNIKLPTGETVNPSTCLTDLLSAVKARSDNQR